MIIKRIHQSARRRSRSLSHLRAVVKALTVYVVDAEPELLINLCLGARTAEYVLDADAASLGIEPGEKVDCHGSRNLAGTSLAAYQQQMLAACLLAPSAKDPIEHYVVSWRSGEMPTPEQLEAVLDIFIAEMGYSKCQIVWASHSNTGHYHLHIVANRIDLSTKRVVSAGDGWEIDRLHQVIALVEDAQGWTAEPNAIYFAKDGIVFDRETQQIVRRSDGSRDGCYTRKAKPLELGQEPGQKRIISALKGAQSWRELHYLLSEQNAAYNIKGSGAELSIGRERMRASDFGREFSFKKMESRLGSYEADVTRSRDPHELYQAALRAERARLNAGLNSALDQLRKKREAALKRAMRRDRETLKQAIDDARIDLAFDRIEFEIKRAFDQVRKTISASYLNRDRWYLAEQPSAKQVVLPEIVFAGENPIEAGLAAKHGFELLRNRAGVDYYNGDGERAISDLGIVLLVYQQSAKPIELALELASTRSDTIIVSGTEEFLRICREIAIDRNYNVVTEDGVPIIPKKELAEANLNLIDDLEMVKDSPYNDKGVALSQREPVNPARDENVGVQSSKSNKRQKTEATSGAKAKDGLSVDVLAQFDRQRRGARTR